MVLATKLVAWVLWGADEHRSPLRIHEYLIDDENVGFSMLSNCRMREGQPLPYDKGCAWVGGNMRTVEAQALHDLYRVSDWMREDGILPYDVDCCGLDK